MSKLEVFKAAVQSKTARQLLLTKKHSPKILFIAGTVGVVGTVVLACRATLKSSELFDQHERAVSKIKAKVEGHNQFETISPEDGAQQIRKLQVKTAVEVGKLYLPAIGLGALSVGALTGSHFILSKRNGALMAGYAGLDRAFKEYRQRVSEEYGADVDRKFAIGAEDVVVEEKTADGTIKTTKTTVRTGKFGGSPYAVEFDERSHHFSKEPGRNAETLMMKQSYANEKLRANGHLFLNELHDMLGLPRTQDGQFVGWVFRSDDEIQKRRAQGLPVGDNYVSLGIFNGDSEWVEAFVDGVEKYAILDPNVDGQIYNEI